MTRLKKSKRALCNPNLKCSEEDLRFGTPEIIARYRAERLKCNILTEIGAGVGFQTVELAKKCKKVYAIESNSRKFNLLLGNIKMLGLRNVVPIKGDGLSREVIDNVKDTELVFVDTERLPFEEERTINTIKPNITELLKSYSYCKGICIEVPPQIENINLNCEKEYISLFGQLNRLNLYFGELKECEKRVVALPDGAVLREKPNLKLNPTEKILDYIYEINPAVIKAVMIKEAANGKALLYSYNSKNYLTSKKLINSPFLKSFRVIESCEPTELVGKLKNLKAGKVILRGLVSAENFKEQTWALEKELEGKLVYHVFIFDRMFICEIVS